MADGQDNDFVDLVAEDEVWNDEMESFDVGDDEVLVLKVNNEVRAYGGICPHQSISLVEGEFENGVLTCRAHEWQFDALTGDGINPRDTCLIRHDVRIVDGVIQVRLKSPVQAQH